MKNSQRGFNCPGQRRREASGYPGPPPDELFQAMLEKLMSGRLPAGALVEEAA